MTSQIQAALVGAAAQVVEVVDSIPASATATRRRLVGLDLISAESTRSTPGIAMATMTAQSANSGTWANRFVMIPEGRPLE